MGSDTEIFLKFLSNPKLIQNCKEYAELTLKELEVLKEQIEVSRQNVEKRAKEAKQPVVSEESFGEPSKITPESSARAQVVPEKMPQPEEQRKPIAQSLVERVYQNTIKTEERSLQ